MFLFIFQKQPSSCTGFSNWHSGEMMQDRPGSRKSNATSPEGHTRTQGSPMIRLRGEGWLKREEKQKKRKWIEEWTQTNPPQHLQG